MVFGLTARCFAELGWEQPVTCRAKPLVLHTVCIQPGLKPGTQQILPEKTVGKKKNLGMWCSSRIARGVSPADGVMHNDVPWVRDKP